MRLRFMLNEVWIGLRRNIPMALSVVIVTFVSLSFVGGAMLLQRQIATVKGYWYDRVQVSIFLCTDSSKSPTCAAGASTPETRNEIRKDLESPALAPYIDQIYYESKEEAFSRFKEQFPDDTVTNNVTAEQMPESFRVKLKDPEKYEVVSQYFTGRDGVEQIVDQRELLDKFFRILNYLTAGSIVLASVMLLAAALLVATTIRLAASNILVQMPFMLEGVIAVCAGATLAVGGLWAFVHFFVQGFLAAELPIFTYIRAREVWLVAPVLFGVGIVLAGVSSLVSLARYLKV
jgi:cell division transport system permease protein